MIPKITLPSFNAKTEEGKEIKKYLFSLCREVEEGFRLLRLESKAENENKAKR